MSNSKVAKNTIVLYARMFFILAVNLYTSRVILSVLGVDVYGIYNVVAGFVLMFGFLNTAMATASARYIAFEQGRGDIERQKKIYSTTVMIHLAIAILIVLLAETIGVWYVNHKMVFPSEKSLAVNFVFQAAILSFFFTIISVPFTSSIIAHEEMGIYALVSIIDALLKLGIVYLLPLSPIDNLIFYSILLCIASLIDYLLYFIYCKRRFEECRFSFNKDYNLFKEMLGFAGWSFVGNFGISAKDYGVNLVLNLFFGPSVNAARAIAFQVSSAINGFVSNFQLALNPQITKRYAIGEIDSMTELIKIGTSISFYLLAIIIIPVIVRADYILSIWLIEIPNYTTIFLQLILLMALINSMYGPISTAVLATGKIKTYQIVVALIMCMDVPLSFLALKLGAAPSSVFIIGIFSAFVALIVRLALLNKIVKINFTAFVFRIILKNLILFIFMSFLPFVLNRYFANNFVGLLSITTLSIAWSSLISFFLGLNKVERKWIISRLSFFLNTSVRRSFLR